jgi:hypothetical protein
MYCLICVIYVACLMACKVTLPYKCHLMASKFDFHISAVDVEETSKSEAVQWICCMATLNGYNEG